jgi:hypothetical protein
MKQQALALLLGIALLQSGCETFHRPSAPDATPPADPVAVGHVATLPQVRKTLFDAATPPAMFMDTTDGRPPATQLPAPSGVADKIAEICKKYGIRSISGSNATTEQLDRIDAIFANLPKGLYEKLAIDCEPANAEPKAVAMRGVDCYWADAKEDGSKLGERFTSSEATGGCIYVMRRHTPLWSLTSCICQHISLKADKEFGKKVATELGYVRTDTDNRLDDLPNLQTWKATTVGSNTFPTYLSKKDWTLHVSALMTAHLRGLLQDGERDDLINNDFTGPGKTKQLLEDRLGPGKL